MKNNKIPVVDMRQIIARLGLREALKMGLPTTNVYTVGCDADGGNLFLTYLPYEGPGQKGRTKERESLDSMFGCKGKDEFVIYSIVEGIETGCHLIHKDRIEPMLKQEGF